VSSNFGRSGANFRRKIPTLRWGKGWGQGFETKRASISLPFRGRETDIGRMQVRAAELKLGERLDANARLMEQIHVFSLDDLQGNLRRPALEALVGLFSIRAGDVGPDFTFPHDQNPLEFKMFVALPDGNLYFVDPANSPRVLAKALERELLSESKIRERYLRKRDRAAEQWVANGMKKVFSGANIYPNYFLEKGSHEKDLLVQFGDVVILIECKNGRLREFSGATPLRPKGHGDAAGRNSPQMVRSAAIRGTSESERKRTDARQAVS